MTGGCVVYVVAKAPRPGACKTRLCPPLSPAQAADLAAAFLQDALRTVENAGVTPRVVCRTADEQTALRALLGPRTHVSAQPGEGLGDALEGAFREGLADRFSSVAVLGADSPTLPPDVLAEGFAALDSGRDVALGPSEDGGYYLLAARAVHPALFHDVSWSTSVVAHQTLEKCRRLNLSVHQLPTWYDVDDGPSFARLQDDLAERSWRVAPATAAVLGLESAPSVMAAMVGARP